MTRLGRHVLAWATVAVACTGLAAALIDGDPDLAAVFGIVALLQAAALIGLGGGRAPTTIRRDLAEWLESRAAATGEPLEEVVDRGLATYRDSLVGGPPDR